MTSEFAKARRTLARQDPVIGELIRRYGRCGLGATERTDPFRALTRAIIGQQLSTKAAATIDGRFAALFRGRPTPRTVAKVSDAELRAVGLSSQKTAYLRDLCARILDGSLDLAALQTVPDDQVVDTLTQVKGIGRWTAEMFLMFRLQRPDVLPVGDLGIVKAVQRNYKLRALPSPERITRIGEAWRPYRSIACWYLWASLENK